jgi:hypothetical protein
MHTLSKTSLAFDSALADGIYFDHVLKRYRYKGENKPGEAITGSFVSRSNVINLQEKFRDKKINEFISLSSEIMQGRGYREATELLKKIHVSEAIIKAGGIDKLNNSDLGTIGSILKKQYYAGVDSETGKSYGLKHLFREIQEGKVSQKQLENRLKLYAKSAELTGLIIEKNHALSEGMLWAKRIDAKDNNECEDCIRYASMGWSTINSVPLPKTMCKCKSNCRCQIIYSKNFPEQNSV